MKKKRKKGARESEREIERERERESAVDISDDRFPQTLMNQFKFRHLAAYFPSAREHNKVRDYSQ